MGNRPTKTRERTCPHCGKGIGVNVNGRKGYAIPFIKVCKALRDSAGSYTRAASLIFEKTGILVTPGFVHVRISREAKTRGITRKELLAEVLGG